MRRADPARLTVDTVIWRRDLLEYRPNVLASDLRGRAATPLPLISTMLRLIRVSLSAFSLVASVSALTGPEIALDIGHSSARPGSVSARGRASGFKPSKHHGEAIEGENRDAADEANGVYYHDDLVVLRTAKQPAVLFEAGVIVNRDEEVMLARVDMRERIGRAVTRGLISCLRPEGKPREKLGKDQRS